MEGGIGLAEMIGGSIGDAVRAHASDVTELRLRCGQPARLRRLNGEEIRLDVLHAGELRKISNRLMENSLYACEEELKQGYFTASGGIRVGVCGKMNVEHGRVTSIAGVSSLCIRIPREIRGCARELAERMLSEDCGALILSPPGMGKTTLVRDLARIASDRGLNVAIADERREIAACREGIPRLDVGCRTDVMDGCPKSVSIPLLLRACAPDVLVADEIGGEGDAEALLDAARCGVRIVATAHAASVEDACRRTSLASLMRAGVFAWRVMLGPRVGEVSAITRCRGEEASC